MTARPFGSDLSTPTLAETAVGDGNVPRLELVDWASRFGLVAGVTTREQGFSLGLWTAEPVGEVLGRWREFRRAFAGRFPTVILGHQVHGGEVRWQGGATAQGWLLLDGVDGHATRSPGVLLAVTIADCIPVYLAAPDQGAVALVHAGWRGVAAGILERAIAVLERETGAVGGDIVMHCGVGICGACYEVGYEVIDRLTGTRTSGPSHVDLRGLLAARAREAGLHDVSTSPFCTFHDHARFFSHRASQGRDGRMVAYLGRPLA